MSKKGSNPPPPNINRPDPPPPPPLIKGNVICGEIKRTIHNDLVRLVAIKIDTKEQLMSGIPESKIDKERWSDRYLGKDIIKSNAINFNFFYNEVNYFVSEIMQLIDNSQFPQGDAKSLNIEKEKTKS